MCGMRCLGRKGQHLGSGDHRLPLSSSWCASTLWWLSYVGVLDGVPVEAGAAHDHSGGQAGAPGAGAGPELPQQAARHAPAHHPPVSERASERQTGDRAKQTGQGGALTCCGGGGRTVEVILEAAFHEDMRMLPESASQIGEDGRPLSLPPLQRAFMELSEVLRHVEEASLFLGNLAALFWQHRVQRCQKAFDGQLLAALQKRLAGYQRQQQCRQGSSKDKTVTMKQQQQQEAGSADVGKAEGGGEWEGEERVAQLSARATAAAAQGGGNGSEGGGRGLDILALALASARQDRDDDDDDDEGDEQPVDVDELLSQLKTFCTDIHPPSFPSSFDMLPPWPRCLPACGDLPAYACAGAAAAVRLRGPRHHGLHDG